ncbi:uncharacterized protein EDB91DRAFT_1243492 [Suillus paluster]|uniref:uncharacterized protein n=1 Tax=Suillus paluster TaxID=48578 RepID=UPI001B8692B1|nr:uncharacterized protein EDB91DRAFT_1243492 [Suillus paluster]KAG1752728.1 hypothetical protein EDB91DRAFT_1243492 [Suillus paluster]
MASISLTTALKPLFPCVPYKISESGLPERNTTARLPTHGDFKPAIRFAKSLAEDDRKSFIPLQLVAPGQPLAAAPLKFGSPLTISDSGFYLDRPTWVIVSRIGITLGVGAMYSSINHFHPKPAFLRRILPPGVGVTGLDDAAALEQPGVIYRPYKGHLIFPLKRRFTWGCIHPDDDDDNDDGDSEERFTMEMQHRIAAPWLPQSAKIVRYFEERQKQLSSKIQA